MPRAPHRLLAALLTALALLLAVSSASAEEPVYVKESQAALDRAKEAYNGEKYEQAAQLFVLAAQIDPGGQHHQGSQYRNLARCFFWLANYDKAVFWYDVYLERWPQAGDAKSIASERDSANGRRNNAATAPTVADIYDRSLLELVETLRGRVKDNAPALTADGGGTTRLYRRAIELGYAMPELSDWSTAIRARLLREMSMRWSSTDSGPLPDLGPDSEHIDVSRSRLANLRTLAPRPEELDQIIAWQRQIDAWGEYFNNQFAEAATSFLDAAGAMPSMDHLAYAAAMAQLRAGDAQAALATLDAAIPGVNNRRKPFYLLLRADALNVLGRHEEAAAIYLEIKR